MTDIIEGLEVREVPPSTYIKKEFLCSNQDIESRLQVLFNLAKYSMTELEKRSELMDGDFKEFISDVEKIRNGLAKLCAGGQAQIDMVKELMETSLDQPEDRQEMPLDQAEVLVQ